MKSWLIESESAKRRQFVAAWVMGRARRRRRMARVEQARRSGRGYCCRFREGEYGDEEEDEVGSVGSLNGLPPTMVEGRRRLLFWAYDLSFPPLGVRTSGFISRSQAAA
jgi:hypothetical protein